MTMPEKNSSPLMVGELLVEQAVDYKIQMLERAVELDPHYAAAWSMLGNLVHCTAWDVGPEQVSAIVDRAYPLVLRAVRLDPESATAHSHLAVVQEARFDWIPAERTFEDNLDIAFNEADPEKLKAAIRAMPEAIIDFTALYEPVLAEFDSPARVLSIVRDIYQDESLQWIRKLHDLAMVAAYFGDPQFALKVKRQEVRANVLRISSLWYPIMSDVRRLPEFRQFASELNLVDYWRTYGWADACRPISEDDFECF